MYRGGGGGVEVVKPTYTTCTVGVWIFSGATHLILLTVRIGALSTCSVLVALWFAIYKALGPSNSHKNTIS